MRLRHLTHSICTSHALCAFCVCRCCCCCTSLRRVRVLEGERAARRAGVLQVATINTIATVGLLDVGTQLALHGGLEGPAGLCYALSGVFGVFVALGFKRVQRLDKFEKEIRG